MWRLHAQNGPICNLSGLEAVNAIDGINAFSMRVGALDEHQLAFISEILEDENRRLDATAMLTVMPNFGLSVSSILGEDTR
ncbi:hypothetical protein P5P81_00120 [Tritonibacter mobilis]|nr:hypothetical protein [Tritonibacter mobilis]